MANSRSSLTVDTGASTFSKSVPFKNAMSRLMTSQKLFHQLQSGLLWVNIEHLLILQPLHCVVSWCWTTSAVLYAAHTAYSWGGGGWWRGLVLFYKAIYPALETPLHIKWEITALFNFAWETSGYYRQPTRCQWFCLSGSPYSAEVFNAQTPTVSLPCRNDSRRSRDAAVQIASTFGWLCCQTTWCFTKDSSNCQFRPWHWFTRWLIKSVMDVCDNSFISHWHELLSVYISSIFFAKRKYSLSIWCWSLLCE